MAWTGDQGGDIISRHESERALLMNASYCNLLQSSVNNISQWATEASIAYKDLKHSECSFWYFEYLNNQIAIFLALDFQKHNPQLTSCQTVFSNQKVAGVKCMLDH